MKLYPLDLILDDPDLVSELFPEKKGYPISIKIKDKETLEKLLRDIFNAVSTKNLIRLLINQSSALSPYAGKLPTGSYLP